MVEDPAHSSPPCLESTFTVRVLVRNPPPHDLSHSPIFHSSHSQWTGIWKIFFDTWLHQNGIIFVQKKNKSQKLKCTWTFLWVTCFYFCRLPSTSSAVCFNCKLFSTVCSGTGSTGLRTFSCYPIIPFAMNRARMFVARPSLNCTWSVPFTVMPDIVSTRIWRRRIAFTISTLKTLATT